MAITVEHREDQFLQKISEQGCPDTLKGTVLHKSLENHKILLQFLDEKIVGKNFEGKNELQKKLDNWKNYIKKTKTDCLREFSQIFVQDDHIACLGDMKWELILGKIKEI